MDWNPYESPKAVSESIQTPNKWQRADVLVLVAGSIIIMAGLVLILHIRQPLPVIRTRLYDVGSIAVVAAYIVIAGAWIATAAWHLIKRRKKR